MNVVACLLFHINRICFLVFGVRVLKSRAKKRIHTHETRRSPENYTLYMLFRWIRKSGLQKRSTFTTTTPLDNISFGNTVDKAISTVRWKIEKKTHSSKILWLARRYRLLKMFFNIFFFIVWCARICNDGNSVRQVQITFPFRRAVISHNQAVFIPFWKMHTFNFRCDKS